jgi:putative transposase
MSDEAEGRASARPGSKPDEDNKVPVAAEETEPKNWTRGSASLRSWRDVLRKHPMHLLVREAHNRAIIVFVTACTAKRRKILASRCAHEVIVSAWQSATTWLVGRYVIMPDHVHLFCAPNGIDAPSLEVWIKYWKSVVTRYLGEPGGAVWQRHYWDRQLRRSESYDDKWSYVCGNPVRHGLVSNADQWPYQGQLNELRW